MDKIKILAIETSCDETAAAVIGEIDDVEAGVARSRNKFGMTRPVVLSNVISSSVELHAKTGGIVPEVASREQMKFMVPVVAEALMKSVGNKFSIFNFQFSNNSQIPNSKIENTEYYQQTIELLDDITHIAVTAGPGLIGSLLVGFNAAKTLAYARDLPIIPINHIEGHLYSVFNGEISKSEFNTDPSASLGMTDRLSISNQTPNPKPQILNPMFPVLALTVSGGHTMLVLMHDHGKYEIIGATIDDAVGEAYDKVARLLGLGYPGGPAISKLAEQFRNQFSIFNFQFSIKSQNPKSQVPNPPTIFFPRPMLKDGTFNFSFSGLKTAVMIKVKKIMAKNNLADAAEIGLETKQEIAAAFEEAVADVLSFKLGKAVEKYQPKSVIFAGGVSANSYLQERLKTDVKRLKSDIEFLTPTHEMSGDNAAMIGLAAYYHIKRGNISTWRDVKVDANLKLI